VRRPAEAPGGVRTEELGGAPEINGKKIARRINLTGACEKVKDKKKSIERDGRQKKL